MVDMIKVLLAKKEVTYGVDSLPTAALNAVLTRNFSSKPVEVDRITRNLDAKTYGATPDAPSNERQTVSYEVELAGSGAAGTAPAWMELLEGAGMAAPALTATIKADQKMGLPSVAPSSLTQHHYIGNQLRKMTGSRGSFAIDITAGQFPFLSLNYTGIIPAAAPFSVAVPAATVLTKWKEPVEVNTANTLILLDGYAAFVRYLKIDANVQTNIRSLVGSRYINRGQHSIAIEMMIEAPSLAAKDYYLELRAGSLMPLAVTHGLVAGNIIEIACANVEITGISDSEEDNKLMFSISAIAAISAGQDDILITSR